MSRLAAFGVALIAVIVCGAIALFVAWFTDPLAGAYVLLAIIGLDVYLIARHDG